MQWISGIPTKGIGFKQNFNDGTQYKIRTICKEGNGIPKDNWRIIVRIKIQDYTRLGWQKDYGSNLQGSLKDHRGHKFYPTQNIEDSGGPRKGYNQVF